ncbi:MAG: GDP-mannose 4,6-dehydratase [Bacillota bacterium]
MNILLTGGAGFIGSVLADYLLEKGDRVTAVDNFDPYYPAEYKERNVQNQYNYKTYRLSRIDIRDFDALRRNLCGDFDAIIHLAAKAGVRPSILDPVAYQEVNVGGTQNLLELAKQWGVKKFIFASSSSVYGVNPNVPWKEDDHVLMPISPYAGTKVSGELLGHIYSHLYGIKFIALRFFTVYGPRQRPDLAIHKFVRLILNDQPIQVFGDGSSRRDYTYIDDIVQGIISALEYDKSRYEIINLGNNQTVSLTEMISNLEDVLGKKARITRLPDQPGDVPQTWADLNKAQNLLNYHPRTSFKDGLDKFAVWLKKN